jgi:acid phosphatase (class A)
MRFAKMFRVGHPVLARMVGFRDKMTKNSRHLPPIYIAMCAAILASGCATASKVGAAASVARAYYLAPKTSTGYDWTVVLAPAPVNGGIVDRVDMETVRSFQALQGTPRWAQAISDASLDMITVYGAILGPDFTLAKRPELVALLAYAGRQFGVASNEAKTAFPRPRPFLADPGLKTCVPLPVAGSSYPSGHAGWGWLSAQILARVEPTHTSALLARGRDYGQSRVVCAVHYPSDIEAGRYLADAVLARLDNDEEYQRLLAVAKAAVK